MLACFVVVCVVALLITVISNAPIIFLRLAELRNGSVFVCFFFFFVFFLFLFLCSEIDMELRAGGWTGRTYLNYTALAAQVVLFFFVFIY